MDLWIQNLKYGIKQGWKNTEHMFWNSKVLFCSAEHRTEQNTKIILGPEHRTEQNMRIFFRSELEQNQNIGWKFHMKFMFVSTVTVDGPGS